MNTDFNKETLSADLWEKTSLFINHLYTYALLISGDEGKAEKVLIKTFKKAFWFRKYLSTETDVKLWIFRIIMNICRNEPSLKQSYAGDGTITQTIDLSNIDTGTIDQKSSFRFRNDFIKEVSSLPFEFKEVLILVNVLHLDFQETAELVDIPDGTIRARLFDARKNLLIKLFSKTKTPFTNESSQINYEDKKLIIHLIDDLDKKELGEEKIENLKGEIDNQGFIKSVVERNFEIQQVREAPKTKIINKFAPELKGKIKSGDSSENKRLVAGATVAMVILIIILIFINRPEEINYTELANEQTGEDNIFVQLKNNYSSFLEEKYNNRLVYGDKKYLKNYLSSSGFRNEPVLFNYKNWTLESCFLTEYGGRKLANFVYQINSNLILYVYQVPLSMVEEEQDFKLSGNLTNYLNSGKCFSSRDGNRIYLLKKHEDNYFGFVLAKPNKDLIIEICRQN
jgi:RNA polymerase sigma-70 factor (ECF subfamily)